MDIESFIGNQVRHRLGNIDDVRLRSDQDTQARLARVCSGGALRWNAESEGPADWNGWSLIPDADDNVPIWVRRRVNGNTISARHKTGGSTSEIVASGADFDFAVDMQDRRTKTMSIPDGDAGQAALPAFVFNRLRYPQAAGQILWPLPGYHDIGSAGFLGQFQADAVPWQDRKPILVWRGSPGGRNTIGKPAEYAADTIRCQRPSIG